MGRFDDRRPVPGSSNLFVARDADHGGAERALRVVDDTRARAVALRARVREAAQLTHPHLARWVAVGEEDGKVLLAREWLPGPALAPGMDPDDAARALVQVLDALAHAHWHDLHHGAIRPSCLVRDGAGRVMLVDLGLASHGTAQGDLRAVADCLEALAPDLPPALAAVVASTHAGAYATARDLQQALQRALAARPAGPLWGRWLLGASLLVALLVALIVCWGQPPAPEPVVEAPSPVPAVAPTPPAPAPVASVAPEPEVDQGPRRPAPVARPELEPVPVPVPAAVPEVVVIPIPAPPPLAPEPVPVPAPLPAPVAPAESPPMPKELPPTGKWTVEPEGEGMVLRLIADARVSDRLGRSGRPVVQIHCARGKATMSLHPGVQSVERILVDGIDSQQVLVRAELGPLGVQDLKWKTKEGAPLTLGRRGSSWVADTKRIDRVRMSYTPFASDAVVADFDWRGLDAAWALAGAACPP